MEESVPDGLGSQQSFLRTVLKLDSSLPLFQPRCSFCYLKIMALHFPQRRESQDRQLGCAENNSGCRPRALSLARCAEPPFAPVHLFHQLSLNCVPVWIGKGSWKRLAVEPRPDAQTCLLRNPGTKCAKLMDLFVLISGATRGYL